MDFRLVFFFLLLLGVQQSLTATRHLKRVKRHWYPSVDVNGSVHHPNVRYKNVEPLPVVLKPTDVLFFLWTKKNPQVYQLLDPDHPSDVSNTYFSPLSHTVVISHGFTEDGLSIYAQEMRNELLKRGDYNVISVDWGKGAAAPWYDTAVKNAKVAGERTGALLNLLVQSGSSRDSLHLVGFSLGAHVMGIAGNRLQGGKVARITGLDPAFPGFQKTPLEDRLDKSDGHFVEVIHTNGGDIIHGQLGFFDPIGHADFYPNGGQHQPGCGNEIGDLIHGACSHSRAPKYFIESINSKVGFKSCSCSDWETFQGGKCSCNSTFTLMGESCPFRARGKYYLTTKDQMPFALG